MSKDQQTKESITPSELKTLIKLAKKVVWDSPDLRKKIQDRKVNIVPSNFYSNIPSIEDLNNSFEYRGENEEVYGKVFDREAITEFTKMIAVYAEEFDSPIEKPTELKPEYYWENPAFSFLDAMSYYCMIRHFKPKRILEIGSGYSTLVADKALKKNGFGTIRIIEPYPMDFLKKLNTVEEIIDKFAQDISIPEFMNIIDDVDIWFIDSTHTVKIGSDCLYLYLKVLPEIKKKLIVHSHDIYLPFGMPKDKALNKHIYWTEQYLLYAYMLGNPNCKVLLGSVYLKNILPELGEKLMAGKFNTGGASIWYEIN